MTSPAVPERPGVFLTARWVHLAMLNFELEPELLADLVPRGTELDSWEGRHFVSVVGFQFLDTRVLGVPIPFHQNFEEVNLRFYVRRKGGAEQRRGVVFVKELVPRRAVAWVANGVYGEKYAALPMSHEDRLGTPERRLRYAWRHAGTVESLALTARGSAELPAPDSHIAYIAEHYWGYSAGRGSHSVEYEVEHPPWRVWDAAQVEFRCDAAGLYGERFRGPLGSAPYSSFIAEGSAVRVRRGRPLA